MATINSSKISGSSLDVSSIVSQLMEVERKPLNVIANKIDRAQVKISALGTFQSKLSVLKDAIDKLQTPENFRSFGVTTSAASVATAQLATGGTAGLFKLEVTTLATNAVVNLPASEMDYLSTYYFQVGGQQYGVDAALPTDSSEAQVKAHYTALRDVFNARAELKDRFVAALADLGGGQWGVTFQGLTTGADNNIQLVQRLEPVGGGSPTFTPIVSANARPAENATFKLNGLAYTRASNAVEVSGIKLNLLSEGDTNIEVRQTDVGSQAVAEGVAKAYNELLAEYKTLTSSNVQASLRGVLNSDSSVTSIMRQVNTQLMGTIRHSGGSFSGIGALGLEFSESGQLVYKPSLIGDAVPLQNALSRGIYLGESATQNLSTRLADTLAFGGVLYERIQAEKEAQKDLSKRQATVEDKMVKLQERYTAQYAALDAMLFRLNNTSTALKSALDALSSNNKAN